MTSHSRTSVTVLADTVSPYGSRVTTFECYYPRIIHGEIMTHRVFSRNAQSSRAMPTAKLLAQDVFIPDEWTKNCKGMSATRVLKGDAATEADKVWLDMYAAVVVGTERLAALGVHKQHANRALEPWSYIRVLITATDWVNFFVQRLAADAQPEIQHLARLLQAAMTASTPVRSVGHLPYMPDTLEPGQLVQDIPMVCAARCARVSYGQFDGTRDWRKDLDLAQQLWQDGHLSPFEHIAFAIRSPAGSKNLRGWMTFRELKEAGT